MLKAFAIKGLALAAAIGLVAILPPVWEAIAALIIALITVGFLSYAIAHPSSQFFVRVVDRLATRDNVIALTFDDGPDPVVTPKILDVLGAHHARATFFVLGDRAARYPELIRRIHREGHAIGTHTQHHRLRFHFGSPSHIQREIEAAVAVVEDILTERPKLFRPPQGLRTPCFAAGWRRIRDLTCVTWSVRGFDSVSTSADRIARRVGKRLAPGAIVSLHDGKGLGGRSDREPTLRALTEILTECEARGLRCVALRQLEAGVR
jgi:peptidoglycan-N-acetylglucosamine deacetylase